MQLQAWLGELDERAVSTDYCMVDKSPSASEWQLNRDRHVDCRVAQPRWVEGWESCESVGFVASPLETWAKV